MYRKFFKRFFDICFALLCMPFFIIVFIMIAPIIYIEDKGTPFYNASRLGKNGKVFKMFKFRSMRLNAPDLRNEDGSTFNSEDDPRLTRIGKFIRKTSIDEIPQILNVLKGDMSIIGPRPDLPECLNLYNEIEIKKIEVLPGITGYNQVYFRNSVDQFEKFKNDVFYVENVSLYLDVKIFFKTISALILKKNIFNKVNK